LLTSRQIFRYAVPARTVTKKALIVSEMAKQRRSATTKLVVAWRIIHAMSIESASNNNSGQDGEGRALSDAKQYYPRLIAGRPPHHW